MSENDRNQSDVAQKMREGMRLWTTGVAVAAASLDGVQHGMTVTSFASISLEPPQVLISLEKGTRTHDLVAGSGAYAVTVLGVEQQALSERFAGREFEDKNRFEGVDFTLGDTGSPIVTGGLAYFDCRVVEVYDAGSHSLFIAEVVEAGAPAGGGEGAAPLLYFDRGYREIGRG